MVEKGKRYKVLECAEGLFKAGEIVIAVTSGIVPFCVREKDYDNSKLFSYEYESNQVGAMCDFELEEVHNA